jgi:AcrR family transcriptional regulator
MSDPHRPDPPPDSEPTAAGPLSPPPAAAVAAETPISLTPAQPTTTVATAAIAATFDERVTELTPLYAATGRILTWGFRVSAALLATGLLLALVRDEPLSDEARPLPGVIEQIGDGHGAGLVDLAIVAMILTPVATVIVVAFGFLRLGDRRYALASTVVLAILAVSVALSLLR